MPDPVQVYDGSGESSDSKHRRGHRMWRGKIDGVRVIEERDLGYLFRTVLLYTRTPMKLPPLEFRNFADLHLTTRGGRIFRWGYKVPRTKMPALPEWIWVLDEDGDTSSPPFDPPSMKPRPAHPPLPEPEKNWNL